MNHEKIKNNCCANKDSTTSKISHLRGTFYYCPMNCEGTKTYSSPGDCPVCGMHLIPEINDSPADEFTCPMHPDVIKTEIGSCPICGMGLVPINSLNQVDSNYENLLFKFKIALLFTLPIFIVAMTTMIPNNPLSHLISDSKWNWIQFILSLPVVFYATNMFFVKAWVSIKTMNLNMFTLIGIGAGAAYIFSVVGLLFPHVFPNDFKSDDGNVHLYFEATTVILSLVLLGQLLEAKAHSKTNGAIKELLKLAPSQALLLVDGKEQYISIQDIQVGNLLKVKPGEKIPVDGEIMKGTGSIDESMITGEPIPRYKQKGDKVIAGTLNTNTSFEFKAEKIGKDTLLAQIINMVSEAGRSRAPIQNLADKVAKYFVPIVLCISLVTFLVWTYYGPSPAIAYGFINAIAVLIIACPCALGLATPMSVMVGVGRGAQHGILIKDAEALELMDKVDILIIDKTGTITEGKPTVEKLDVDEDNYIQVLTLIASLNNSSEHPIAQAIVSFAKNLDVPTKEVDKFKAISGKGVYGTIDNSFVLLGNRSLMFDFNVDIPLNAENEITIAQKLGSTISYIAIDGKYKGYVSIIDKIKPSSIAVINELQKQGLEVRMLTGDNKNTALSVANQLGIKNFKAECLPEDKLNEIEKLKNQGKIVAMAGDGINDAPALASANIGIAMGTGSDVAIESAKITLVSGDLKGVVKAKKLSHQVMKNIKQNLFFAFVYNAIGIPVAAGLLYPFVGLLLSPMIAAAAMSFSSVSVIANALRLRGLNL